MKNILITGGAGFIGSNLALALLKRGYTVTILDNLSPQIHGDKAKEQSYLYLSIKDKVHFIEGSVTEKADWEKALINQDAIIHLAAETGTGQSMYQIARYSDVNIGGTALMLDILANSKSHQVQKIIIASSRSIYGEGKYLNKKGEIVYPHHRSAEQMSNGQFDLLDEDGDKLSLLATDENSKIHPSSVYGITKQNQEQMIMTVCPTIGIEPVAYRYQNVYGPGQSLQNPYTGILSIFSTLIRNHQAINIFEDGKESRDFVYIDDVVQATLLGLEKEEANGQVFNVGTGVSIDVLTIAKLLIENYHIDVPLNISGNFRLGDIRHNYADLSKISTLLAYKPLYHFEEGLRKFCQWVITQSIMENSYEASINEMRAKGLLK